MLNVKEVIERAIPDLLAEDSGLFVVVPGLTSFVIGAERSTDRAELCGQEVVR